MPVQASGEMICLQIIETCEARKLKLKNCVNIVLDIRSPSGPQVKRALASVTWNGQKRLAIQIRRC
jgi:hypothetical protein